MSIVEKCRRKYDIIIFWPLFFIVYIFTRGSIHTFKNVLCLSFANDMSMDIDFYFAMGINFFIVTKKLLIMSLPNKISYYCVNWQKVFSVIVILGGLPRSWLPNRKNMYQNTQKIYKQNKLVVLLKILLFRLTTWKSILVIFLAGV